MEISAKTLLEIFFLTYDIFFFQSQASGRPRRVHIIDLSMSTQPTETLFLQNLYVKIG